MLNHDTTWDTLSNCKLIYFGAFRKKPLAEKQQNNERWISFYYGNAARLENSSVR